MSTPAEILARLHELNPEALLLEPRLMFGDALVDVTNEPDDRWPRTSGCYVAVYDAEKCIEGIMLDGCDYEDAVEHFDYNTSGAWMGEGTPTFRYPPEED